MVSEANDRMMGWKSYRQIFERLSLKMAGAMIKYVVSWQYVVCVEKPVTHCGNVSRKKMLPISFKQLLDHLDAKLEEAIAMTSSW